MAATQTELGGFDGNEADTIQTVSFDDKDGRDDDMAAEIEQWVDQLAEAAAEAKESDLFEQWMETQAAFHDYSRRNSMLITMQKPEATRVAGFRTWQNEFNRTVKSGESAIWIWRPNTVTSHKCPQCGNAPSYHAYNDDLGCDRAGTDPEEWDIDPTEEWEKGEILCGFSPAPVFDISQTEPMDDEDDSEAVFELPTEAKGEAADLLEPTLAAGRESFRYSVDVVPSEEWNRRANGYCTYSQPPEIRVERRTPAATVGTLVHEYAHAKLHVEQQDDTEEAARELEAEAVSYIVGRHFGLDTENSAFYLASWANDDTDQIKDRLDRISDTATEIIDTINDHRNE